jgi:DNA-binding HxlR family transcriptional regulator
MAVNVDKPDSGKYAHKHRADNPLQAIVGFVTDADGDHQKLLSDRVRLGILSSLSVAKRLSFKELKRLLGVSDGNLSTHARKLEDAGLIECHKSFDARTPKTEYVISVAGRRSLQRYLKHMEALIRATAG